MKLNGRLPQGFKIAKPVAQESYDENIFAELDGYGRLTIARKRDGWKVFALIGPRGSVRLYTDGINEIDSRLDHIREEIERLGFPPHTLLVGEVLHDTDGNDDLTKVISVMSSKEEKALQEQERHGYLKYMVFAMLDISKDIEEHPWYDNYCSARDRINGATTLEYVMPMQIISDGFGAAKNWVQLREWEGLVLFDRKYLISFRLDGKSPKRPKGCYKWKPIKEDDFIVREWRWNKEHTRLKDLILLQIDPETGDEFECGKIGTFNNETRTWFQEEARYPLVVQVAFESRYAKSGKVRSARYMRVRDDKPVKECIAPKSFRAGK